MYGSNLQFNQWRKLRDKAIALLVKETGLGPSRIARLWHDDLYRDGKPVAELTVPARIAPGGREYKTTISDELRAALKLLYPDKYLFLDCDGWTAFAAGRPQGRALSARQISRIVSRRLNGD